MHREWEMVSNCEWFVETRCDPLIVSFYRQKLLDWLTTALDAGDFKLDLERMTTDSDDSNKSLPFLPFLYQVIAHVIDLRVAPHSATLWGGTIRLQTTTA